MYGRAPEGKIGEAVRQPRDRLTGQPQERHHSAALGGTRVRLPPAKGSTKPARLHLAPAIPMTAIGECRLRADKPTCRGDGWSVGLDLLQKLALLAVSLSSRPSLSSPTVNLAEAGVRLIRPFSAEPMRIWPISTHRRPRRVGPVVDEARSIAANVVKLPDLIRRSTAFLGSKLGNNDGEAR